MDEIQLTSQQMEAVTHGEGPLLIVAGAGTGKTLVITHRIAHLVESKQARPEEVLAVTFTEKAAAEMAERVDVILPYGYANVQISTFHAFGDRILREFGLEIGFNPDFRVLSQAEQFIFFREHLFDFSLNRYRPLSDPTRFIQAMLNVISRAKDEDVTPEAYLDFVKRLRKESEEHSDDEALKVFIEEQEEVAGTYTKYQEILAREGRCDFGDQVSLALRLLRSRPTVLKKLQDRYRFILVDEFQDTNFVQFQLVKILGGDRSNITVVGDDDQSIYKFRGAAITNILNFIDAYPQTKRVVLTENFRSTQIILDHAYRLIQHNNPDRLEAKYRINKRLVAHRPIGAAVEHFHCDSIITESDHVAAEIENLVRNRQAAYGDIAILVRTNQSADPFLQALNVKQIPWRFSGSHGLYSQPEVKVLIAFLRVMSDFDDSLSLYHLSVSDIYDFRTIDDVHRCVNFAHRTHRSLHDVFCHVEEIEDLDKLTPESRITIRKIVEDLATYLEMSRTESTGSILYHFLRGKRYLERLLRIEDAHSAARVQNIAKFFDVIWAFSQVAREDRVIHFVRHLDLLIEAGDDPGVADADADADAVHVLTVHKAKGLEWPVVFLVSLINHRFPHTRRREPIELPFELVQETIPPGDFHLQEERRLFYVGMTRAKDRLIFTSAEDYGGIRTRKVSPFILEALDRRRVDGVNVKAGPEERIRRFAPDAENQAAVPASIPATSILNLSHFQIDDYQTCPLKYKYVHILRVPILPHHTVIYGKALHAAVELYHRSKTAGTAVRLEDLHRAYEGAWKNTGFLSREHAERRFEAGKRAIQAFLEREERSGIVPILVEESFNFMVEKNRISGRWDRIDEREGRIVIIDFKSSEVYQQKAADQRAKDSLQLAIYTMAYQRMSGRTADRVELHFLESGLVGSAGVTEKMLVDAEKTITASAAGIRARNYTAKPSYLACQYCAYTDVCPSAMRV